MRPKAKFKPGKKIFFERLASLVTPLSPLSKFSIRSLFQEKRKATFVLVGIFLATFISLFGSTVVYGYMTSVDKQFNYYQLWDNQIIFDSYYNSTEITSILQRDNLIDSIDIYEPVILLPVRLSQEKTKIYTITGLQPSTVMRQFDRAIVIENKLIITKDLAIKYNLKRNSSITFDIYGVEKNLEISDIINEFSGSGIYCSINTARFIADITSSDLSNALYIQSSNPDLVEETLSDDSEVFKVVNKHKLKESLADINNAVIVIIIVALIAALLVGVSIAVTIVSISISDRRNDFINFRALGVSNREIFMSILLELIITGIGGIFIGFIISIWLVQLIFEYAAMFGMVLIFELTPFSLILTIANVILGVILATYLSLRSLFKSSISEETVSRIIG